MNTRIETPGKFEGEPIFAPYFWDIMLEGGADHDCGECVYFIVSEVDVRLYPELSGIYAVRLDESAQGFVFTTIIETEEEYDRHMENEEILGFI